MKKHIAFALLLATALGLVCADTGFSEMSLRQKIMQKIMLDFTVWSDAGSSESPPALTKMTPALAGLLRKWQPGGVILFKGNLPSTKSAVSLISAIRDAVMQDGAPGPLLAVDQEGGRITRLVQGASMPGNLALGAADREDYARLAGTVLGEEVRALGFNMDIAPSLDVFSNPVNPVIGVRSFGEDPRRVGALGTALMDGLREAGVIPVLKHSPGHGDTQTDSHTSLPLVERSREEITKTELAPFAAAIQAGAPAVMSAHIQFPALDDTRVKSKATGKEIYLPATLSRKILTGLLREEMGFEGVILTDAMDMDAISVHFGASDALVRAFAAGVDIAVMPVTLTNPADFQKLEDAVTAVEMAVKDGRIREAELDASVERILALKDACNVTNAENPTYEAARSVIASPEHRAIEREIARASITVLQKGDTVPFSLKEGDTLLLIGAYENEVTSMRWAVNRLLKEGKIPKINVTSYCYNQQTRAADELKALVKSADAAVLITEISGSAALTNWHGRMPGRVAPLLEAAKIPWAALNILLPQGAALLPNAPAIVCCYNASGMSEAATKDESLAYGPSIPAAIDVILGAARGEGRLPAKVYALTPEGNIDTNTVLFDTGA